MYVKVFLLLLCGGPLFGALPSSWTISELRLTLDQIEQQLHANRVEIKLLHEKMDEEKPKQNDLGQVQRVVTLEKNQEKILSDIKKLKDLFNDSFTQYEKRLTAVEKEMTQELISVKNSLASLLKALKKEETTSYTVQPGDSLSEIAKHHHVSLKALREINKLKNDNNIIIGQKLLIPS